MAKRPIDRILTALGDLHLTEGLAALPGSDLTALLLDVMGRRVAGLSAADVMRQRASDRFVAPGGVDLRTLHATEADLLAALPDAFSTVVLSPLAPAGLHGTVAGVSQNNVVSTIRRTDVAADPTTGLAIEAARRRVECLGSRPRSDELVRLASIQRVVRAQVFEGSMTFAHFSLLGIVTAGRDTGSRSFEVTALAEHSATLARCLLAAGADRLDVRITDWTDGKLGEVVARLRPALAEGQVNVVEHPERVRARGYYQHGAFEITATIGDLVFSAADGGLVDWTQKLVGSRKERLMISGIGIDRVAASRAQAG